MKGIDDVSLNSINNVHIQNFHIHIVKCILQVHLIMYYDLLKHINTEFYIL